MSPVVVFFLRAHAKSGYQEGKAAATGPGVETLDILAVVVYPDKVLDKLGRAGAGRGNDGDGGTDDDVFQNLGRFVDDVR